VTDHGHADERLGRQLAEALQIADQEIAEIGLRVEPQGAVVVGQRIGVGVLVVLVLAVAAHGAEPEAVLVDAAPGRQGDAGIDKPDIARDISAGPDLTAARRLLGRGTGDHRARGELEGKKGRQPCAEAPAPPDSN
jgi:hypothetical protein